MHLELEHCLYLCVVSLSISSDSLSCRRIVSIYKVVHIVIDGMRRYGSCSLSCTRPDVDLDTSPAVLVAQLCVDAATPR